MFLMVLRLCLLFLSVAFIRAAPAEVRGRVCQSTDFLQIQETCREQNDVLLAAEKVHDDAMVCKSLFELWRCVATHVPVCFHNLTEIYKTYFHSPHNCLLSHQQIMELQNLTMHSAQGQGEKEVDVDIVPLSSSSVAPVDVSSSTHEDERGGESEEEEEVDDGHKKGDSHKHTGSGASISTRYGILPVVTSWVMAWRMTSYLFHS